MKEGPVWTQNEVGGFKWAWSVEQFAMGVEALGAKRIHFFKKEGLFFVRFLFPEGKKLHIRD
jgi:hypothetical protein